ncbi:hypothetical protein D1007_16590 [Hordeum vulgare]|nr:hypothetical protein D1007_16590 [Hordeum vulgare]
MDKVSCQNPSPVRCSAARFLAASALRSRRRRSSSRRRTRSALVTLGAGALTRLALRTSVLETAEATATVLDLAGGGLVVLLGVLLASWRGRVGPWHGAASRITGGRSHSPRWARAGVGGRWRSHDQRPERRDAVGLLRPLSSSGLKTAGVAPLMLAEDGPQKRCFLLMWTKRSDERDSRECMAGSDVWKPISPAIGEELHAPLLPRCAWWPDLDIAGVSLSSRLFSVERADNVLV